MRWRGRRPSAVTAVVRHRRDGRFGGAPCGLERDQLVRLRDDLAGRLEVPELRVEGARSVRGGFFFPRFY